MEVLYTDKDWVVERVGFGKGPFSIIVRRNNDNGTRGAAVNVHPDRDNPSGLSVSTSEGDRFSSERYGYPWDSQIRFC